MAPLSTSSIRAPQERHARGEWGNLPPQEIGGHLELGEDIYDRIYADLKDAARGQLRHYPLLTMSPTLLVNETWLRVNQADLDFEDRRHLIGVFVQAMRYVVVDEIRRRMSMRRGGNAPKVDIDSVALYDLQSGNEDGFLRLLSINQALENLEELNPRLAQIAVWRYFGGLTDNEIARYLGVTTRTVAREWKKARAFLLAQMEPINLGAAGALI